jgi:protein gp37
MAKESKIEWTHATFNPWRGCVKVSPGCANCYAEGWAKRTGKKIWGADAAREMASESYWKQPERWNADAAKMGQPFRVFCSSLADVCEDRPDLLEPRARLMRLIEATPNLTWLLLSKRPHNFNRLFGVRWGYTWPQNVWAMTTAEDQERADERIPHLLNVWATVRGISCEPALGPVDFSKYLAPGRWGCSGCGYTTNEDVGRCKGYCYDPSGKSCDAKPCPRCAKLHYWSGSVPRIHWVICGGESGAKARPMVPDWARAVREQCRAAGVPFLFKQWGEWAPFVRAVEAHDIVERELPNGQMAKIGKAAAGRRLDGRTWDEYPGMERQGADA